MPSAVVHLVCIVHGAELLEYRAGIQKGSSLLTNGSIQNL